jgi:GGDEF domain-containing protein
MASISELGHRASVEAGCSSRISISAGVAMYPMDATDAEGLLEKADERMYEEKRARQRRMKPGPVSLAQTA